MSSAVVVRVLFLELGQPLQLQAYYSFSEVCNLEDRRYTVEQAVCRRPNVFTPFQKLTPRNKFKITQCPSALNAILCCQAVNFDAHASMKVIWHRDFVHLRAHFLHMLYLQEYESVITNAYFSFWMYALWTNEVFNRTIDICFIRSDLSSTKY